MKDQYVSPIFCLSIVWNKKIHDEFEFLFLIGNTREEQNMKTTFSSEYILQRSKFPTDASDVILFFLFLSHTELR